MRTVYLLMLSVAVAGACATSTAPAGSSGVSTTATPPTEVNRGTLGVSPGTALFVPGQSESYVALPEQIFTANLADVTWSVDNPAVATVTPDGRLTAIAPGFTWLRGTGADGVAVHPISVSSHAPIEAAGDYQIYGCGSPHLTTCSAAMKAAGVRSPMSLRYRTSADLVVAEFWMGNSRNRAALVGRLEPSGTFRFGEAAPMAPVVSLGAGGCCPMLREFVAQVTGDRVLSGDFAHVTSSATHRYRLLAR